MNVTRSVCVTCVWLVGDREQRGENVLMKNSILHIKLLYLKLTSLSQYGQMMIIKRYTNKASETFIRIFSILFFSKLRITKIYDRFNVSKDLIAILVKTAIISKSRKKTAS